MPKTNETNHFFNKDFFSLMKNDAVFMSIGRGSTVNEDDLILFLKNKKIRGAVLDVYE